MLVNAVSPFEGILHWVGTPREGTSQKTGEPWKMVDFVLAYQDSQMQERFIVFTLSDTEKVNSILRAPIGAQIRVTWRPDANSYNDQQGGVKWFPSYRALRIVPVNDAPQPQQQYPAQGTQMPQQSMAYPPQFSQPAPQQHVGENDLPW